MDYTDVSWDKDGKLIIKNEALIKEMTAFVGTPSNANAKNHGQFTLFQVVTRPMGQEPMDLLCRIIVEFPVPPKP